MEVSTLEQAISDSLAGWRFRATLLGIFAGLALAIAIVGVYGVVSYSVAQRTHEIGVRIALGAKRSDVVRLVVHQGLRIALYGLAVGIAVSLAMAHLISGVLYGVSESERPMLYGVKATDPATLLTVAVILTGVVLCACYIPARRAAKVDPVEALRYE